MALTISGETSLPVIHCLGLPSKTTLKGCGTASQALSLMAVEATSLAPVPCAKAPGPRGRGVAISYYHDLSRHDVVLDQHLVGYSIANIVKFGSLSSLANLLMVAEFHAPDVWRGTRWSKAMAMPSGLKALLDPTISITSIT